MVQGMAFLSKKRFNPTNLSNQKEVWEARQRQELDAKRIREREDQLRRERDDEELARARGGSRGGNEAALRFMYGPPPGLPAVEKNQSNEDEAPRNDTTTPGDVTKRQPGDDDAAAAFRVMLAATAPAEETQFSDGANANDASGISGAALAGTTIEAASKGNESLTALEKAVGRKDANRSLTLEEQIARFPQLKNAPMAKGMSSTNVNVNFKPLGTQLRHIRCLACGVWGHSRGDRECELSGWNPFATTSVKPSPMSASGIDAASRSGSGVADDTEMKQDTKRRRDDELDGKLSGEKSSDSEESRRRRKKRKKKHKSSSRHRKQSRRRSRSSSPEDDSRRKSHKKRRKHSSRHD